MKLFEKRPLSLILCIMLGGFSLFADKSITVSVIAISVALTLLALSFLFGDLLLKSKLLFRICCIAFSFSVALAIVWTATYFPSVFYNQEVSVRGVVTFSDHSASTDSTIVLRTEELDGDTKRHNILITADKDDLSGINTGDRITVTLTVFPIEDSSGFNRRAYYISRGYSALGSDPRDVTVESRKNYSLQYYFDQIRLKVSNRFKSISNEETGGFLAALLTGERSGLDPNTELNFVRTGISHILALSGAHLVILTYAVMCLLKPIPINKRWKTAILMLFVLGYMALTGMSACITRAGAMLIITSALYLLSRKSDSVTSLVISVCMIVAFQPRAVFDISLWLSAVATLGIIFMSYVTSRLEVRKGIRFRLFNWLLIATLASVFAISACFAICLVTFDSFSTLGVIATIVFTPITELLIYVGLLGLLIGDIVPLRLPLVLLTELMKELAEWMASPSFALISLDYLPVKILIIILTVYFYAFLLFGDKKRIKTATVILCVLFILVNAVGVIQSYLTRYDDGIVYAPSSGTDSLLIRSEGEVAVIASGCNKYSLYDTANLLESERITSIDYLIIPSYNYYTSKQIHTTIGSIRTERLYLPEPQTTVERDEALWIAEELSRYGCDLRFYKEEQSICIGSLKYALLQRMHKNEASITRNIFALYNDDQLVTYCSRGATEYASVTSLSIISQSNTLIIGANGTAQKEFVMRLEAVEQIVFGYELTVAEHLTEYYEQKGVELNTVTDGRADICD